MKALLIYSGGMDSTVMLNELKDKIKLAVNFQYGGKHNEIESTYAEQNCTNLGIPYIQIPLNFVNDYFNSDLLLSGGDIPEGHYEDESMKRTVIPFRNGIMLSIATGLAESKDLDTILIANHKGDHAIYPDCRGAFIDPMARAIENGTYNRMKLYAPYTHMSKRDIALRGHKLNVDFSKTYSCYKGKEIHCGKCGTCTERKEALQGFDLTQYEE